LSVSPFPPLGSNGKKNKNFKATHTNCGSLKQVCVCVCCLI
jgi:hypothetical protein